MAGRRRDTEALALAQRRRKKSADRNEGGDQKFFRNHISDSKGTSNRVLCGIRIVLVSGDKGGRMAEIWRGRRGRNGSRKALKLESTGAGRRGW